LHVTVVVAATAGWVGSTACDLAAQYSTERLMRRRREAAGGDGRAAAPSG
jgi:NADPH-dependent curcumin reductase CurA